MKLRKTILPMLICFSLVLTSFGAVFATETPQGLQTDESGTYLIGTADELFAFAELAKSTAEADKAIGNARTAFSAKLTADINLNPGTAFTYDHETGLVTVAKGGQSYKMGTGMKGTELGNFHPVYNGLCTQEYWDAETTTEEERNALIAEMNEKVEALGLRKWTPIGTEYMPYIGFFNGNGHTIDGLYINDSEVKSAGLFGVAGSYFDLPGEYVSGEVKNLTIGQNSLVVGHDAGDSGATGAFVGRTNKYTISDCTNYGLVVGKGNTSSYNINSNVSSTNLYGHVGSITGLTTGKVQNCVNHGTVVSRESAGGIVGNLMGFESDYGSILHSENYGNVYADAESGYGRAGGIAVNAGGKYYRNDYGGLIEGCTNYGYVEGGNVGGIVQKGAHDATIKFCANHGKVFATSSASGIVDYIYSYTGGFTMEGCYNAGVVSFLTDNTTRTSYPLAGGIYKYTDGSIGSHTIKNCYNDKTVCPAEDNELFEANITNIKNCHSVTTEVFATGEPAYNMGSYNSYGWRQNIPVPAEDGKTLETYPTLNGTRRVYQATHYCCHTDDTNREKDKIYFYTNVYGDITDEHTPDENGICSHCEMDVRLPIFLLDTLPEAKVGNSYNVTIRVSEDTPSVNDYIKATVSETDDTAYTFSHGLTGKADWSYYSKYYYYISGTPTEAGTLTFTLSAENENGTTKKTYTLKINEADPLEITTDTKLDNATAGAGYSRWLSVNSSLETTWALAEGSALPAGLALDEEGGITGTPTTAGQYTFTVVASAGGQTATKEFTLIVLEEGGCKHRDMTTISGLQATCRHDGVTAYYHCNTCDLNFFDRDGKNEVWNKDDLKTASNHSDKNSDGVCDFCGKDMPIFKKVTDKGGIVYGGTYIFVTKISDKYYALALPPEPEDGKDESGRAYTELMNLCEITPDENGDFTFNALEASKAIMLKTDFAAENGNLDAGTARYGLSSVFNNVRYGLSDSGPYFWMYPNEPAKYGYRITLDNSGAALIGSVYQSWWSSPETADNGLLRAFDMNYEGTNTNFMTLYAESYYNGEKADYSGAEMTSSPIYLYRMTDVGKAGDITYTVNDANSKVDLSTFPGFFGNYDDALLSNVNGITNAVNQTAVTTAIEAIETEQTSVTAQIFANITANDVKTETDEKGNQTATSVTYSITLQIVVSDEDGNILMQSIISDSDLSGAPITVTLHTGGISPAQIIHYKEDGTKEYFYSEWSEEVRSGAKSFEYENGFVTITIDSFSDIKILANAEPEEELTSIAVPAARTDLVYTGSEQQGVPDGTGYTLTGHKATDAGTDYKATATLDSGYQWNDGTTTPKEIVWSIEKANPSVSNPTGLSGTKGNALSTVTLPTGWAWKAPTTVMSATGNQTFAAVYTPTDTTNYNTKEANLTVNVTEPPVTDPAKPTIDVTGTYTYTGSDITANVTGYDMATMDITGNVAKNAGDYTVSVTSKTGKWADGSTEAVTKAWSIAKATPTGTPKYTSITTAGKTLADAALTTTGADFSVPGSVKWVAGDGSDLAYTTTVVANTYYKWLFTPTDADNYKTLTGTIRLYYKSSGDGSSSGTTSYTVSFETNGGSKITSQSVTRNAAIKEPTAPTKENFDFAGWYTDKEFKTKYDFSEKVTKSFTLYAKWIEKDNSINQIILTIGKNDAKVFGQTKSNDVAPKIVNNRTMLPARFVAENLGAKVEWNGEKKLVTITGKNDKNENVTILITIGAANAVVNGKEVKLDSPAFIENNRTYAPIRFISEELGAKVEWDGENQMVIITRAAQAKTADKK